MPAIRRIVAGVSGSPGSVHALRHAAGLARHHHAALIPLLAWLPPGGDLADRKSPDPELRQLWQDHAWQQLWETLETAFGGLPASIDAQPVVLRGKPGKALTLIARQDGDLLVIGAGHQGPLQKLAGCGVSRYCLAHADCPVLAIPPPPLAQEACYGLRGWAFRHRWIRAAAQPALAPIHHVNGHPGGSQARPSRST
jgi:nucleotide-binding universal stress UspA family protein